MRLIQGMGLVNRLCKWWTGAVLAFLYLPIALLVIYSFNSSRLNVLWEGFTLRWYRELFSNEPLVRSLKNSLIIAGWSTAIAVVLGTTGAWLLHRYRYRFTRLWEALLFIPMAVPEVIMGVSLLILFTALGPLINGWLDAWFGVAGETRFSPGFLTTILAHVTFCFPFVLVTVQARLADTDPSLEEAALDLGASPLTAFRRIMIPCMMPAIVAGALLAFTLSMDEVLVTYFVCGPESKTLPLEIYDNVRKGLNPMLNAISAVFIAATAVLVVVADRIRRINRS
jgi:spermidine/putrescine transport system permease protein